MRLRRRQNLDQLVEESIALRKQLEETSEGLAKFAKQLNQEIGELKKDVTKDDGK